MKQIKKFAPIPLLLVAVLTIGYFMKEDRTVFNFGDTYYVLDYFTVSLLVFLLLVVLILATMLLKRIFAKKANTENRIDKV